MKTQHGQKQIIKIFLKTANSASESLGWDLGFCISNKLPRGWQSNKMGRMELESLLGLPEHGHPSSPDWNTQGELRLKHTCPPTWTHSFQHVFLLRGWSQAALIATNFECWHFNLNIEYSIWILNFREKSSILCKATVGCSLFVPTVQFFS